MRYLSKSKYLAGLQCPKLLWHEFNRKDIIPPPNSVLQFAFEEGHRVGALAQKLFPGGILIPRKFNPEEQSIQSLEAAKQRKPLFEAGFIYKRAYAIADILDPVGDDQWDLYEVKSSTGVKDEHMHDAAFQRYTYEGAGLKIRKCFIVYINKEFVRHSDIEPKDFFLKEDITKQTEILAGQIDRAVDAMLKTIEASEVPNNPIGPYCSSPHDCPLIDICWKDLPQGHIFLLYQGGQRCFDLMEQGILKVTDIPDDYKLNTKQVIQIEAHRKEETYIDKEAIHEFLAKLQYPLYFLDFETMAPAIPVYDNTGPYKAVPFQFSLHVVEKEGNMPIHHPYLAPGDVDPRPEVLRRLKELLGDKGSIIAYSAGFEKRCLKEAAFIYPQYLDWVKSLDDRIVDLLEPFKNFSFYHPKQEGSASLKYVLPAITHLTYKGLEIGNGGAASAEYYRVTFTKVDEAERQRVRTALDKYCDLDTMGMVEILEVLKGIWPVKA
ncbi:MAG: DUF2779 domain-containing protein [Candidatus Margulisiibacteriota bacterium]